MVLSLDSLSPLCSVIQVYWHFPVFLVSVQKLCVVKEPCWLYHNLPLLVPGMHMRWQGLDGHIGPGGRSLNASQQITRQEEVGPNPVQPLWSWLLYTHSTAAWKRNTPLLPVWAFPTAAWPKADPKCPDIRPGRRWCLPWLFSALQQERIVWWGQSVLPEVALEAAQAPLLLAILPALCFWDPLIHSGGDQYYEKRAVIPQLQHPKHYFTVLKPSFGSGGLDTLRLRAEVPSPCHQGAPWGQVTHSTQWCLLPVPKIFFNWSIVELLCWFQVYRKVTQLRVCVCVCVCIYIYFQITFHHRLLWLLPRAIW